MKYLLFFLISLITISCENNSFDSDKRQLIAKDEIRENLGNIQSFDVTHFEEDTVRQEGNAAFQNEIRYTLRVIYKDSAGVVQNKDAFILFTPDGKSVISSHINN